ncbi:MAG: phosphate acetyltransferase, partial [Tidjanibacter sp.]|nr:phosphate acetyltransferase [Tidjanibacter sp.]
MSFIEKVRAKAAAAPKRIVLPEATEKRTLQAADIIIAEALADVILIGNPDTLLAMAEEMGLQNISRATIIDPANNPRKDAYVELMVALRGKKGLTPEAAEKLLLDPLYLGAVMVKAGDADGEVAGADNATGDVLRPALQYVKTLPGISVVSGAFVIISPDKSFG